MSLTFDEAEALWRQADAKVYDNNDYEGGLKDAMKCLRAFENLENKKWQGRCFSVIGAAHESLGNYQDALKYYHKKLEISLQLGDKGGEGRAY